VRKTGKWIAAFKKYVGREEERRKERKKREGRKERK
jgi:Sec-independent protein translocase protein TatA